MPYVRKYRKRLFRRRPKTSWAARKRMYKRMSKRTKIHTFRRVCQTNNISIASDNIFALTPQLADLPNSSEFTTLYDQYKIKKVIYRIEKPFTNNSLDSSGSVVGNTYTTNKFIRVVHDYDGGTLPTSENQFFEYDNMKSYSACGVKPIRITLYPKVLNSVFLNDTATNTAIAVAKPQWLDVAYPNVKHYGLKLFCPQLASTGNSQFLRIIATYIIQCKNTR